MKIFFSQSLFKCRRQAQVTNVYRLKRSVNSLLWYNTICGPLQFCGGPTPVSNFKLMPWNWKNLFFWDRRIRDLVIYQPIDSNYVFRGLQSWPHLSPVHLSPKETAGISRHLCYVSKWPRIQILKLFGCKFHQIQPVHIHRPRLREPEDFLS